MATTTATAAPTYRKRFWETRSFQNALTGWLFATPILLFFVIWVFGPILASLTMLFFDWNGFGPLAMARFVGIGNIRELMSDDRFMGAFVNTFKYAVITVVARNVFGLLLAMALHNVTRFVGFVRAIYYMPVILPGTAMSLLWGLMYQNRYGIFNQVLIKVGLPRVAWLTDPRWAMISIAIMVIWKGVGWNMVIYLAGLKAIPEVYYEAARIDGANAWHQFARITMPMLRPTLLFTLVMSVIGSLQVFGPVFILTQGGPANKTNVVVYNMYLTAFENMRFSYATSQAVALFVVILIITLLQMTLLREGGLTSYYD
ncbi:MAG: sugar ABC transporter permease [Chloroflexi bacterium]|nr:sugar ABC transporter permease [Chloroflexota bacterium]